MTAGPTQNYAENAPTRWRPRPVLATTVRASATLGPVLVSVGLGAAAAHWLPAERLGLPAGAWLFLVVAVSTTALVGLSHWLRRLVPLSALLRLSLVLPDRVPSRFSIARRTWSTSTLAEKSPADGPAEAVLALVGTLAAHDARTRAHGERVQAYAALIGRELGLAPGDVDKLSWAALLHDVGKVHVPIEVINKEGRPNEEEWAALREHPTHGGDLVEPLRGWLGPWLDGVAEHHERYDGQGYPHGSAGAGISLSARIIAVADTYDVITSARSYKKPMSAEQARAEITRCAGSQFDPEVVRALLGVGLGRLRFVAGPSTLLAALPGLGSAPAQAVSNVANVAQTAGGQVLAAVLTATVGVGAGAAATGSDVLAADLATASAAPAAAADLAEPAQPTAVSPTDLPSPEALSPDAASPETSFASSADGGRSTLSGAVSAPFSSPVVLLPTLPVVTTAPRPSPTDSTTAPTPTRTTTPVVTSTPTASRTPGETPATDPTRTPTGQPTTSPTPAPVVTVPSAAPSAPSDPSNPAVPTDPNPTASSPTTAQPTTTPTATPTTTPTTTPSTPSPTTTPPTPTPTTTPPTPSPTRTDRDCATARAGGTNLQGADLRGCDLRGLSLAGDWEKADLRGANLEGARLSGLDLGDADLRGADLDGATLLLVDLSGTDLQGASFRGAFLTAVNLTDARWDRNTFAGAVVISVTGVIGSLLQ